MDESRYPGEQERGSSCSDCCERVAWSSIVATFFTLVGISLVCAFTGLSNRDVGPLFSDTYIEDGVTLWFFWLQIAGYIGLAIMLAVVILLMTVGCMSTGYQHAASWCAFQKAKTGRRQLSAFLIVTYIVNLAWYVIFFGSTMPLIFVFMLHNGVCSNTAYDSTTCLDLRQFGLAPQDLSPNANQTSESPLICGLQLLSICGSDLRLYFFLIFIGCVLVLLGMNHFFMSLAGNFNWLRVRKRRQKLQLNRRSGNYDVSSNVYTGPERQLSEDSNAHLRRSNLNYGSSSNVLSGSHSSIPTVAAQMSLPSSSTSLAFVAPSRSATRSPTELSTTASQYSAKISNQTYGFDRDAIVQQAKPTSHVSFEESWTPVTITATRSSTTAAARTTTTAATKVSPTPVTRVTPNTSSSTRSSKADTNNLSNGRQDRTSRFDHFNPAFDENYWDNQYGAQLKRQSDDYYSRGHGARKSHVNGSATGYEGGNLNQGYYNYDYDVADGSASGFEMKPASSYAQDNSQARDRKGIGNKFFEYQL